VCTASVYVVVRVMRVLLSVYVVVRVMLHTAIYVVRVMCVFLSVYVFVRVNEPGKIIIEVFGLLGCYAAEIRT
jgi:hypothetical protein